MSSERQDVFVVLYHNGFPDEHATIIDVCETERAAEQAIAEHKANRDKDDECELYGPRWWMETRSLRKEKK
jgi:hypothetical protein